MRGASEGEGLGNQFLANIREVDAIVHVVRAHHDANVIHPEGEVDPRRDIDTIETELLYADLEQAERRLERVTKQAPRRRQAGAGRGALGDRRRRRAAGGPPGAHGAGAHRRPRRAAQPAPADGQAGALVANVDEGDDAVPPEVAEHAAAIGALAVAVSSRLEAELSELDDDDASAMRDDMGSASPACAASSTAPSRCCTRSPSSPPARTSRRSPGTCARA